MSFNDTLASGSVSSIIDAIADANGSAFVQEPVRTGTRQFLYALLNAYGVIDEGVHRLVSDKDLCALYATARGSMKAGQSVANRIAAKYGAAQPNPLLDPVTITQTVKARRISDPVAPPAPPATAGDYATNKRVDDVKSGFDSRINQLRSDMNLDYRARVGELRSEVKEGADELRRQLTDTLTAVTDALPEVVKGHVADALKSLTPVTLSVVLPNSAPVALGMVHRKTGDIIKMLAAGVNVYLHGPAGSGKTTAGRKCAEAFGLDFYFAAKVESEYMLLGFKDARGETVRTQFREAYEHGGVFLFDELDGSSPGAVVALNAALANGICPFPDGIIMRHENFKCIAAGNTKLSGASRQYVGRSQLDAASIDRFAFVEFGYDDALETALATNSAWCEYVQAARKAVADRGLPHLITPRATYDGCKLIEAGLDAESVSAAVLWKGLDAETVGQVLRSMPASVRSAIEAE